MKNGCFLCVIQGYEYDTYIVQGDEHQYLIDSVLPPCKDHMTVYDECHFFQ
jgi:hypothetical protein